MDLEILQLIKTNTFETLNVRVFKSTSGTLTLYPEKFSCYKVFIVKSLGGAYEVEFRGRDDQLIRRISSVLPTALDMTVQHGTVALG